MAKTHPDRLFIGVDPNHKGMEKLSAKAIARPAKGGLENVMFVLARVEDLPEELDGQANQVLINFPWAGLLEGLVRTDPNVWRSIRRICQSGAFIDIVFGYQEIYEGAQIQGRGLPAVDDAYIYGNFAQKLDELGFSLIEHKTINGRDLTTYPTSWAKRLGFGRQKMLLLICHMITIINYCKTIKVVLLINQSIN